MLKTYSFFCLAALSACLTTPAFAAGSNCFVASYYGVGDGFHGRATANGETFNAHGLTAAHRTLPFGTKLLVRNPDNGKSVVVRINDRGPYHYSRGIDLSYAAFNKIASASAGVTQVCVSRM